MQIMNDSGATEETKVAQLNRTMKAMVEATVTVLAQSVREIRTPTAVVQESDQISEFMHKCDRAVFNRIKDHAISLREASELRPLRMKCMSCQHQYEQVFTMDMARFFVSGS